MRGLCTLFFAICTHALLLSIRVSAHQSPLWKDRRAPQILPATSSSAFSSPVPAATASDEISTMYERRVERIIGEITTSNARLVGTWISSQLVDGTWSDVDYTTGCDARRASWPAQGHWLRALTIAAAYHGGLRNTEEHVGNETARAAVYAAMDWWFGRDFGLEYPGCLDRGGTEACPCGLDVMYNTNWYSNIILIPGFVSRTCLLMGVESLNELQLSNCTLITGRSYEVFENGVGETHWMLTGANTLDVANVGIDLAIFTGNETLMTDAYRRVHEEMRLIPERRGDGVHFDGSFGQHDGMLYNGNYGKDYHNAVLHLETQASQTSYSAGSEPRKTFETLFEGSRWMIYRNVLTNVLHWDFSAVGRMISFAVQDFQATQNIKTNLTEVKELGEQWESPILESFANELSRTTSHANAGDLTGHRMFYSNDYMVHRGSNYVTTWKGYSSRTKNTECTNSQNTRGFHLADGTVYTLIQGDEYEDIAAAWDWNLIPGITVDYDATPLNCGNTEFHGIESFVGGVSDGSTGMAVMRYTNPFTRSLSWQKTWFFLDDDVQHVMISSIYSSSNASVYSVLDQRRHKGSIFFDDTEEDMQATLIGDTPSSRAGVKSLYHGNVGYTFESEDVTLSLQVGEKTGDWSVIGTGSQPPATVDLFTAWLQHDSLNASVAYTAYPGVDFQTFLRKKHDSRLTTVRNDGEVSAVFDEGSNKGMVTFWEPEGGHVLFGPQGSIYVGADKALVVIVNIWSATVTVADPSQSQSTATVTVGWGGFKNDILFELPSGGHAGSSVSKSIWS